MLLGWIRAWKRRRRLSRPFPDAWEEVLRAQPFVARLTEDEKRRLRDVVRILVEEKHWEGVGGLDLTDLMKVELAAQAARLVLGNEDDPFPALTGVVVYPSSFVIRGRGLGDEGLPAAGEAWHRGPVVIAWDSRPSPSALPGSARNVVLHEFAHALDLEDGWADGTPALGARQALKTWAEVMTEEHEKLVEAAKQGRKGLLDRYGATNPAEFFAVITETFFENPKGLLHRHPSLYEALQRYYRQDPVARLDA